MKIMLMDPSGFSIPYDHCLANALEKLGCRVVLATARLPFEPQNQHSTYELWKHFYRISNRFGKGKLRTYLKGCEHPFDMERLIRRLHCWKPNVIHFQWVPFPAVDKFFLGRLRKIAPLVLTVHDTMPFHGSPSSRFQLVGIASAFKQFDHYIVHTHYSKAELIGWLSVPEDRVTVIPHGVFDYYKSLMNIVDSSSSPFQLPEKKKVLFFGVLKPYKGVDILLEAFARLPSEIKRNTVLRIVGLPKMPVKPLQDLALKLEVTDSVLWELRYVKEEEVGYYFSQADVIVLPYRRIDQSGVLMTALAFGKPIVASRVGGFPETITDGVHGFLVEPGDPKALAEALATVLKDDSLRKRMARAVSELAGAELSWDSIAQKTIDVYRSLKARHVSG